MLWQREMGNVILVLDAGSSSLKFAACEVAERPARLSWCFDMSFHRTHPEVAQAFALPRALSDEGRDDRD